MTLFDCLVTHAHTKPGAPAYSFLDDDGVITQRSFSELLNRVKAVSVILQARAKPGSKVVLTYDPGLSFVEAILACFACGVVAVPIPTIQNVRSVSRFKAVINDAGCHLVLTDANVMVKVKRIAPTLFEELPNVDWIQTDVIAANVNDSAANAVDYQPTDIAPDALAFLQYTSGSTGVPKGVMVGHNNIMSNQATIKQAFNHDHSERVVGWLPAYHDMGLIGNIFQTLYLGAHSILFAPMTFLMSPISWLRAVSEWKGTTSGAPSFAYELCTKRITDEEMYGLDLSSWKVAFNGAEPVRADVIDSFAKRFSAIGFRKESFYPCYGMAESTLFVSGGVPGQASTVLSLDKDRLKLNEVVEVPGSSYRQVSCGSASSEHAVAIASTDHEGQLLPDGQVGEIWVSGASVAQGYWNNPDLTEATFQARAADGTGPYLRTGDLGFLRRNELFITGRIKDIIIVRGQNHYPTDIEATLTQNDELWLREGCAAVFTIEKGVTRLVAVAEIQRTQLRQVSEAALKEISARARKAVSDQHGLQLYDFVLIRPATLSKTSSGKIQRTLCRSQYESGLLSRVAVRSTKNTEQRTLVEG